MVTGNPIPKREMSEIPETATPSERMKALIETLSSYIEHYHGGSVDMVSFDGEILKVRMGGACVGCELSTMTLQGWVKGTVQPFFPDLKDVVSA